MQNDRYFCARVSVRPHARAGVEITLTGACAPCGAVRPHARAGVEISIFDILSPHAIVRPHARAGVEMMRYFVGKYGKMFALMRGRELKSPVLKFCVGDDEFALMRGRELKYAIEYTKAADAPFALMRGRELKFSLLPPWMRCCVRPHARAGVEILHLSEMHRSSQCSPSCEGGS